MTLPIIEYIDNVIDAMLASPSGFASSTKSLEEQLMTLEDIREFAITGRRHSEDGRMGYADFMTANDYGAAIFSSEKINRLSPEELQKMKELCTHWKKFMASEFRVAHSLFDLDRFPKRTL
jgi:hypothetical protein